VTVTLAVTGETTFLSPTGLPGVIVVDQTVKIGKAKEVIAGQLELPTSHLRQVRLFVPGRWVTNTAAGALRDDSLIDLRMPDSSSVKGADCVHELRGLIDFPGNPNHSGIELLPRSATVSITAVRIITEGRFTDRGSKCLKYPFFRGLVLLRFRGFTQRQSHMI
jgi:hypothetical protein